MRSNLAFITQRIPLNLAESGTDVFLSWEEWPGGFTIDPVDGSRSGTPVPKSEKASAFLHYIEGKNAAIQQFNEIAIGDCIADFSQEVVLEGRTNLKFTILGEAWVPKPISDKLKQSWSAVVRGQKLFCPVLLRRAT